MKALVGILMSMAFAAPAAADTTETVGIWTIQGSAGTCSATTTLPGEVMLMVFGRPPGGENEGGLMIGDPNRWHPADGPVVIELAGKGSVIGKHDGRAYAELSGYWLPFQSRTELAGYPDSWQLKALKDGTVLVDQPVTGFKAMVAALTACAAKSG